MAASGGAGAEGTCKAAIGGAYAVDTDSVGSNGGESGCPRVAADTGAMGSGAARARQSSATLTP